MNAAGDIVVDRSIDHNEIDWYRFVAKVSGYYTISTETPTSDLDTIIGLYSQSGTRLTYNDNGPNSPDSQLVVQLSPGMAFYVGVTDQYGSVNGGYTLRIDGPPLPEDAREDNDTRATATNLGSIVSAKTFKDLSCLDDDWYQFSMENTGGSADFVKLDFTHSKGDLDLELYDRNGNLVGTSTSATNSEKISLNGKFFGTYYVRVFGAGGVTNPSYTLTVDGPPLPKEDSLEGQNDTRDKAYSLGFPKTPITTTGLVALDDDWYRISLSSMGTPGDYVRIDFQHAGGDLDLELYDQSGNRLAYSDGSSNSEQISLDGLFTTYYIRVFGYAGARNLSYSLSIKPPADDAYEGANDTRETRTDLKFITGRKHLDDLVLADEDWYIFGLGTTGLEGCGVTAEFDNMLGDVNIELRNMSNQVIASSTGTSNTERISFAGLASASYYLRVFGQAGARNPGYDLTFVTPQDDTQEQNDTRTAAKNLGTVVGRKAIADLALLDEDWFKFTTTDTGGADSKVRIDFQHAWGDVDMELYNSAGTLVGSSGHSTDYEEISLNGLAKGTYSVRVYGYLGAKNMRYSLTVAPGTEDLYEQNDTRTAAWNIGTVTSLRAVPDIVVADQDWFKFTTTMTGAAGDYVKINFLHSQGDVDLVLYDSKGILVGTSSGTGDEERISLEGLAAGLYSVKISGLPGVRNPDVMLTVDPPSSGFDGIHTLYLNFDGTAISAADLTRWAGTQWDKDWKDNLDKDNNGVLVSAFQPENTNRETVISLIMNMVQADLAPYGINVVRRTGLAVENTFSTTVFIGQSTVTANAHIACSIDDGNIDKTDVAFVGEEYYPDDNGYAIKLADVILHEAGHTFGLYHVASGNDTESMGLRYNTPSSQWTQDTSFRDQAYRVLQDHGPDIMQNSHRYMLQTFVAGIVAIPGIIGNGGITSNRFASSALSPASFNAVAKLATAPPPPPEEGRSLERRKFPFHQPVDGIESADAAEAVAAGRRHYAVKLIG